MSDFMALLMNQQNEHQLQISLERRRLQREAAAAAVSAGHSSGNPTGRLRRYWARMTQPTQPMGRSARAH